MPHKSNRVEFKCEYCGKKTNCTIRQMKIYKHHFCSRKCYSNYIKVQIIFNCEQCGKEVTRCKAEYKKTKHHFCSPECFYKYNTGKNNILSSAIKVNCVNCGKEIKRFLYEVKQYKDLYCNRKCMVEHRRRTGLYEKENNPSWKGGITDVPLAIRGGSLYQKWRNDVFKRDQWTCQECGQKGGYLNVHHLTAFVDILIENNINTTDDALDCGELYDVDNGITLCKECHVLEHKRLRKLKIA